MSQTAIDVQSKALPAGWKWVKLGDVASFVNGKAYNEAVWATSGYPIIRIQNLNNAAAEFNYWSGTL